MYTFVYVYVDIEDVHDICIYVYINIHDIHVYCMFLRHAHTSYARTGTVGGVCARGMRGVLVYLYLYLYLYQYRYIHTNIHV